MADLRTLTLEKLRAMARRLLGPGHTRLRTKAALVAALAEVAKKPTPEPARKPARKAAQQPSRKPASKPAKKPAKKPSRTGAAATPARRERKAAEAEPKRTPARKREKAERAAGPGGRRRARPPAGRAIPPPQAPAEEGGPDPAAFFVARVRGEEAVRGAPHFAEASTKLHEEPPGELPASYGEDALVVLPRDPRTLFVYWDHAPATLREGFRDLDSPRVELWLWARAREEDGWELARRVELALESRGYYVHDVDAGRTYRAELRVLDRAGRERLLGPGSGDAGLPPGGPSPIVDDRFVRIPWDRPLGPPVGPGHRGPDFPAEAREALAARAEAGAGEAWSGGLGRSSSPGGGPGPGRGGGTGE